MSAVIRTRLLDMALTPFGVIVSIQIDGAYEGELVIYSYLVALRTAEESPGWLLIGTIIRTP